MSDKASHEFVNMGVYHVYKLTSAWMVDQNPPDNIREDLQPDHLVDGKDVGPPKQVKTIYKDTD
ncbi:MAG: hypothetical protein ABUK20_02075 [Anaerolineales bacterium]